MSVSLNSKISILSNNPIIHSQACEKYVSVKFDYSTSIWEGWVPIEDRRTGTFIDFDDKNALNTHLNNIYEEMSPNKYSDWKNEQDEFWGTKQKAGVQKEFFDVLEECVWKCGKCELPNNPNPQKVIQGLKDSGYTIATDTKRYCHNCKKETCHRIMLRIPRNKGFGYETFSSKLRAKIISVLNGIDVYENRKNDNCLPDHKFPEIRWDDNTKSNNPDTMTDDEIRAKFQLLTNQRNQQKREVCRKCFNTGKRGTIFGIPYFYSGGPDWDITIPQKGKAAEKGCIGCPWYDIAEWRKNLNIEIENNRSI